MKRLPLGSFLKTLSKSCLAASAAIALNGCGGSSGDGSDALMVAPASLDNININFFNAFFLNCSRLSGTRGHEFGAVDYSSRGSFQFGIRGTSGAVISSTIVLPDILDNVRYSYLRTGTNSGRLEVTWDIVQVYPFPTASQNNTTVRGHEMFWGGDDSPAFGSRRMVADILFGAEGGFLGDRFARIQNAVTYLSVFGGGTVTNTWTPWVFDSPQVIALRMPGGRPVEINYDPYGAIDDETPASAVWTTLRQKIVVFTNTGTNSLASRINFIRDFSATPPPLPGGGAPEEYGRILVNDINAGVQNRDGTYAYRRTGGDRALLTVQFSGPPPDNTLITRNYDLDFESLEAGIYVELGVGTVGEFYWFRETTNP